MAPRTPHARRLIQLLVAGLAVIPAGCGAGADASGNQPAGATQISPGRLVIVGGALAADNAEVYRAILEARSGEGPLCVLPTSSGVPEESMASAVARFDEHGGPGTATGILLAESNAAEADSSYTAARIRACAGFFFTGGSQSRVFDVFRPGGRDTPAYVALLERWQQGAVVAGSSAGAAMMSARAITGGNSADALLHGLAAADDDPGVRLRDGTDLVPWATLDQHFLARGRWGRLLVALVSDPRVTVGVGIDENTALVVDGEEGRVTGASGVIWMDGRSAALDPSSGTGEGVTLHLLGAGDRIHIPSGRVTRAPGRAPLAAAGPGAEGDAESGAAPEGRARYIVPVVSDDVFERWAFLHFLSAFAASELESAVVGSPDRPITLEKAAGFTAVSAGDGGVQGSPAGLSLGPIRVSLGPPPQG